MTNPTYPYDETYPFVVYSPLSKDLARFKKGVDAEEYIEKVGGKPFGWKVIDTTPPPPREEGFYLWGETMVFYFGGKNKDDWYKVYDHWNRTEEPDANVLNGMKRMTVDAIH